MVLFIMMLISTMLMYYYFQRAQALERDIRAVQRGEMAPGEAGKSFAGRLPWVETSNTQPPAPAPEPGYSLESASNHIPATPPVPPPTTRIDAAATQPGQPQPPQLTAPPEELDNNLRLDPVTPADTATSPEDPETPEDATPADYADEVESNDDGEPSDQATQTRNEDEPSPDAAEPAGASLYDLDPPPVRVRAPRRN